MFLAVLKVSDAQKRIVVTGSSDQRLDCPPEEDWTTGRDSTIARIRANMGAGAPWPESVYCTLERLQDEDTCGRRGADRWHRSARRPRTLTEEDDLYIGLLICEGHSQRTVTSLINAERQVKGLALVDRKQVRDAEQRVELRYRRRAPPPPCAPRCPS